MSFKPMHQTTYTLMDLHVIVHFNSDGNGRPANSIAAMFLKRGDDKIMLTVSETLELSALLSKLIAPPAAHTRSAP